MKLKGNIFWVILLLAVLAYFFLYKPSDQYGIYAPGGGIKLTFDKGTVANNLSIGGASKSATAAPKKKKKFFQKIGAGLKKALPVLKKIGGLISPRVGQLLQ